MSEEDSTHSNEGLDGSERQHISDDDVFDDALDEQHSQSDAGMDFEEDEQPQEVCLISTVDVFSGILSSITQLKKLMLKRATNRGVLINVLLNMQWPLLVFQLLFGDFARAPLHLPEVDLVTSL
uniref:CTNNB1 binding N-teminal domain-containing protein n=1 Tax=Ascaris lumbricoides TaxID=6252 RepID=A0A0M3I1N6_ASCLU